jgi:hypothetical protein
MPYLLRGIDVAEEDMRASVINTLISVAEEQSAGEGDIISEHASTIIAALLENADHRITPSLVGLDLAEACVIHDSFAFPSAYVKPRYAAWHSFRAISNIAFCIPTRRSFSGSLP